LARILVCDDSAFMRMMLKKILNEHGHNVVAEAGDGAQAVQMFRRFRPDVVTMDITMPIMDGIQAVKLIRAEDPVARIVMVSAIGQRQFLAESIAAGASAFLVKPFDPRKVVETINRVLK